MENKTVLRDYLSIISQCKRQTNDIWHAHFGHVFKFSYSYFDHIKRAPKYKDITLEKFRFIINTY
ncbi:hypothetical protein BHL25_22150 [Bacillus cereus]|nr:hypothetical protein BHL25_22150 [Bacillus cereus]